MIKCGFRWRKGLVGGSRQSRHPRLRSQILASLVLLWDPESFEGSLATGLPNA